MNQVTKVGAAEIALPIKEKAQEGQHIEFKRAAMLMRDGKNAEELVRDITAMANADGRRIYSGIREGRQGDGTGPPIGGLMQFDQWCDYRPT